MSAAPVRKGHLLFFCSWSVVLSPGISFTTAVACIHSTHTAYTAPTQHTLLQCERLSGTQCICHVMQSVTTERLPMSLPAATHQPNRVDHPVLFESLHDRRQIFQEEQYRLKSLSELKQVEGLTAGMTGRRCNVCIYST